MNGAGRLLRDEVKRKLSILLTIAPLIIIGDQITKLWVEAIISPLRPIQVVENFFHVTLVRNTGGAFGILSGFGSSQVQNVFVLVTIVAVVFIGFLYFKLSPEQSWPSIGIALIMGGAVGNLIDRIRLGAVIDFIDLHFYSHHWPAFNVADSAITIGAFIVGTCTVLKKC